MPSKNLVCSSALLISSKLNSYTQIPIMLARPLWLPDHKMPTAPTVVRIIFLSKTLATLIFQARLPGSIVTKMRWSPFVDPTNWLTG